MAIRRYLPTSKPSNSCVNMRVLNKEVFPCTMTTATNFVCANCEGLLGERALKSPAGLAIDSVLDYLE